MNKAIIMVLVCLMANLIAAKAQLLVTGTDINKLEIQYVELVGHNRLNAEAVVWIDFGKGIYYSRANEFLKPSNDGESIRFSSLIDALNYLYKNGWEVVSMSRESAPTERYHYLLRRRNQVTK